MEQARDWSAFLSEESKARKPSPLKAVANHLSIPGIISLGGGYFVSFGSFELTTQSPESRILSI